MKTEFLRSRSCGRKREREKPATHSLASLPFQLRAELCLRHLFPLEDGPFPARRACTPLGSGLQEQLCILDTLGARCLRRKQATPSSFPIQSLAYLPVSWIPSEEYTTLLFTLSLFPPHRVSSHNYAQGIYTHDFCAQGRLFARKMSGAL